MIRKLIEGLGIRALPGVLNLLALVALSDRLTPSAFGLYSTAVAVAGFITSMVFGPLTASIVAHHAKHDVEGRAGLYESTVFTTALAIALILAAITGIISSMGLLSWTYIAPAIALGIYTLVLEFSRARLNFWSYGIASVFQSIAFLAAIVILVQDRDTSTQALLAFTLSYVLAIVVSLGLSGWPRLIAPDIGLLIPTIRSGGGYTLSIALENGLYLGMRFVVMLFGSSQALGVFSFSVDLAQRVVGIFTNITSFIVVPLAFRGQASGASRFNSTLYKGGAIALLVSIAALVCTHALRELGIVPVLNGPLFDPAAFTIISFAVIVNRLKKLTIDPFALRANRAAILVFGFAVATPIALGLAIGFQKVSPLAAPAAYLCGYIIAAISTFIALRTFDKSAFT
ncbi:hypothetical protein [Aquabacter cavernae]|uniref:hypothetical protein n=1 Tax=Aquabacter cavernae TaxID=2496029 RepID=UPI000F8C6588|nr:hypothetical protein [Aquabacter cavernae]